MKKVALTKGDSRYNNILNALNLLKEEINRALKNKKRLVLKPNFVTVRNPLSSTNVNAVYAVLDFLAPLYPGKILIAEKASVGKTEEGFKNYHYLPLLKKYNVDFFNLAKDEFFPVEIYDAGFKKIKVIGEKLFQVNYPKPPHL